MIGDRLLQYFSRSLESGLRSVATNAVGLDAHGDASFDPIVCETEAIFVSGSCVMWLNLKQTLDSARTTGAERPALARATQMADCAGAELTSTHSSMLRMR